MIKPRHPLQKISTQEPPLVFVIPTYAVRSMQGCRPESERDMPEWTPDKCLLLYIYIYIIFLVYIYIYLYIYFIYFFKIYIYIYICISLLSIYMVFFIIKCLTVGKQGTNTICFRFLPPVPRNSSLEVLIIKGQSARLRWQECFSFVFWQMPRIVRGYYMSFSGHLLNSTFSYELSSFLVLFI